MKMKMLYAVLRAMVWDRPRMRRWPTPRGTLTLRDSEGRVLATGRMGSAEPAQAREEEKASGIGDIEVVEPAIWRKENGV